MPGYVPQPSLATTPQDLQQWIERELQKIAEVLMNVQANPLVELHAEPVKRPNGLVVLADGTNWNPGAGRGVYWYDTATAAWKLLG